MSSKAGNIEPDLRGPKIQLPETIARNEKRVKKGFWKKLAKFAGYLPFAQDLAAAYHCAMDPQTPLRVRAVLLAALAYFIMPADLVPDIILGLGFTDDAAVIATAIGLVSGHIKDEHHHKARITLQKDAAPTSR